MLTSHGYKSLHCSFSPKTTTDPLPIRSLIYCASSRRCQAVNTHRSFQTHAKCWSPSSAATVRSLHTDMTSAQTQSAPWCTATNSSLSKVVLNACQFAVQAGAKDAPCCITALSITPGNCLALKLQPSKLSHVYLSAVCKYCP